MRLAVTARPGICLPGAATRLAVTTHPQSGICLVGAVIRFAVTTHPRLGSACYAAKKLAVPGLTGLESACYAAM